MRAILIIVAATMVSCATVRQKKIAEFREATKDICIDNPHEVKLAQILYIQMVNN